MRNIDAVIEANKAAGGAFFDHRTVLYFKNKVLPTMYGEKYFISYDLTEDGQKLYTVRQVLSHGLIGHVGERHAYTSKDGARAAIANLMGARL